MRCSILFLFGWWASCEHKSVLRSRLPLRFIDVPTPYRACWATVVMTAMQQVQDADNRMVVEGVWAVANLSDTNAANITRLGRHGACAGTIPRVLWPSKTRGSYFRNLLFGSVAPSSSDTSCTFPPFSTFSRYSFYSFHCFALYLVARRLYTILVGLGWSPGLCAAAVASPA